MAGRDFRIHGCSWRWVRLWSCRSSLLLLDYWQMVSVTTLTCFLKSSMCQDSQTTYTEKNRGWFVPDLVTYWIERSLPWSNEEKAEKQWGSSCKVICQIKAISNNWMSCRTMVTPYHAWEVKVHGTKLGWTALPERSLDKALWNSSCQPSRKLSFIFQKTFPDALHWSFFTWWKIIHGPK